MLVFSVVGINKCALHSNKSKHYKERSANVRTVQQWGQCEGGAVAMASRPSVRQYTESSDQSTHKTGEGRGRKEWGRRPSRDHERRAGGGGGGERLRNVNM